MSKIKNSDFGDFRHGATAPNMIFTDDGEKASKKIKSKDYDIKAEYENYRTMEEGDERRIVKLAMLKHLVPEKVMELTLEGIRELYEQTAALQGEGKVEL